MNEVTTDKAAPNVGPPPAPPFYFSDDRGRRLCQICGQRSATTTVARRGVTLLACRPCDDADLESERRP